MQNILSSAGVLLMRMIDKDKQIQNKRSIKSQINISHPSNDHR